MLQKKISVLTNEGVKVLVFCFLLSSVPLTSGCFSQKSVVLHKTVMKVNNREISTQEFAERLALRLRNFDALYAKEDLTLTRAKEDTAQAFVLEVIAQDYADKQGIKVDLAEVDAKVNEIRSRYPDNLAFRRALADENLAFESWRAELAFSVLQKKIFQKITAGAPEPTENELKEFYEANKVIFQQPARIRLRQVVLEKEDDAKRIYDELSEGGDLAKLAKKFSVAPEGSNGGNTGWIDKGTLEIFDQGFKMPIGSRSKILKSPYGYHIFEVLKKEPEGRLSFQEARAKIRAQLMERRQEKVFSGWLEEQVRKTSVQRNDALIQAIKVTTRGS